MKFDTFKELTNHLVEEVADAFPDRPEIEIEMGYSNVSCSAYINAEFWELDEDGDQVDIIGSCKVRFSDHADRYGSGLSIRFDGVLDSDEMWNVVLADWRIEEMVAKAVSFIKNQLKEQEND